MPRNVGHPRLYYAEAALLAAAALSGLSTTRLRSHARLQRQLTPNGLLRIYAKCVGQDELARRRISEALRQD